MRVYMQNLWTWIRKYLIFLAILITFGVSMLEVTRGTGPRPQQPPEGYLEHRSSTTLQWNRGTTKEPIQLQISIDDPAFKGELFLDKEVSGKTHALRDLEQGKTFYWRLVSDKGKSPVFHFVTSDSAVEF